LFVSASVSPHVSSAIGRGSLEANQAEIAWLPAGLYVYILSIRMQEPNLSTMQMAITSIKHGIKHCYHRPQMFCSSRKSPYRGLCAPGLVSSSSWSAPVVFDARLGERMPSVGCGRTTPTGSPVGLLEKKVSQTKHRDRKSSISL
jgi:hypothetical protein